MEVARMIYDIISDLGTGYQINEKKLIAGIKSFINENDLQREYLKIDDKDKAEKVIKLYLQPITSMPADKIIAYFENYDLIRTFRGLSNETFNLAERKLSGQNVETGIVRDLRKRFEEVIKALSYDEELLNALESEISEINMDMAYLSGESYKTSLRLGEQCNK